MARGVRTRHAQGAELALHRGREREEDERVGEHVRAARVNQHGGDPAVALVRKAGVARTPLHLHCALSAPVSAHSAPRHALAAVLSVSRHGARARCCEEAGRVRTR